MDQIKSCTDILFDGKFFFLICEEEKEAPVIVWVKEYLVVKRRSVKIDQSDM